MKSDQELKDAGFTESGLTRYKASTTAYCDDLFSKAMAIGERDRAEDGPREITHEHVRSAAVFLSVRGNNKEDSTQKLCQVGEYVCAAAAGVGGGKLDQSWGVILFGLSLTIGVILFVIRSFRSQKS